MAELAVGSQPLNEADVREDVAAPFLAALGYAHNTPNDILRELSLKYDKIALGRSKSTDPPVRGRADYVLAVLGAGRWTLEAKASNVEIDTDAVAQATSYARHFEIGASYAAILNGERFVLHRATAGPGDAPLIDCNVETPQALAEAVSSVLSPEAIRRDCGPPKIDLGQPLAPGFRSSARLLGGNIVHHQATWSCNTSLPPGFNASLTEACRRLQGLNATITGGEVWRDESSRVRARFDWASPHEEIERFMLDKKIMEAQYVANDSVISTNAARPTLFDVSDVVAVDRRDVLFDVINWTATSAGFNYEIEYWAQVFGHLENKVFTGEFNSVYDIKLRIFGNVEIQFLVAGAFHIEVDER